MNKMKSPDELTPEQEDYILESQLIQLKGGNK